MKVLKWLDEHFEEYLLMIIVVSITLIMLLQVFMRKVVGSPLTWPEEICRYLFLWSGYLGLGYCFKKKINLKIDFVVEKLPKKIGNVISKISELILIAFLVYIFWASIETFMGIRVLGQKSPALEIPMSIIYFAPVFGYGLGIIRLIQSYIKRGE